MAFAETRDGKLYYELIDQVVGWQTPRDAIVFHHGIGAGAALWLGWLPQLVDRLLHGEAVVITQGAQPVAHQSDIREHQRVCTHHRSLTNNRLARHERQRTP